MKIRQLEWGHTGSMTAGCGDVYTQRIENFHYHYGKRNGEWHVWGFDLCQKVSSPEEAMEVAQKDFETRVMAKYFVEETVNETK